MSTPRIFILAAMLLGASIAAVAGPPKAMADIHMKDGTVHEAVEIEIPANDLIYVKAKLDGKKSQKLDSKDIQRLVLWHKKTPDDKHLMIYEPRREINFDKGTEKVHDTGSWLVPVAVGENLTLLVYAGGIDVDKKGRINMSPGYHTKDKFFTLWKKGDPNPVAMPYNALKISKTRKWLANFLSDDPAVVKKIEDGDYIDKKQSLRNGSFWCPILLEQIVADYAPASKK